MRKHKIKTSLYLFIASIFIFLATAVAIIISQGASVTENGVKTNMGVLRINIYPENINYSLFVDDVAVENIINKGVNLPAGVKDIRIESVGMNSWKKKVEIQEGIVKDIFVKLFPTELKLEQVTNTNVSKMVFSELGDYIFYTVETNPITTENGIWRLQIENNNLFIFNNNQNLIKFAELNEELVQILNDKEVKLIPSPDNNKMLVISPTNKKALLLNNALGNESLKTVDMVSVLGFYPNNIDWLNDSISLIIEDNTTLFEYNLTNNKTTLIKYNQKGPVIFGYNKTQLIWFDSINKTLNQFKNEANQEIIFPKSIVFNEISNIFIPDNSSRYALISDQSEYYLVDLDKKTVQKTGLDPNLNLLIDISADATTFLFNNSGKIVSLVARENLALGKIDINVYSSNEAFLENDKIAFTPKDSTVLIYSDLLKTIQSSDQDGLNKNLIINNINIVPYFNTDSRLENLYLLLNDGQEEVSNANIYKINLLLD